MQLTDVRIKLIKTEDSKLKAVASITIDECFVVHDVKIISGAEGLFVAMPSKKAPDGTYKDIAHPIKPETREYFNTTIIASYQNALEEAENQ